MPEKTRLIGQLGILFIVVAVLLAIVGAAGMVVFSALSTVAVAAVSVPLCSFVEMISVITWPTSALPNRYVVPVPTVAPLRCQT